MSQRSYEEWLQAEARSARNRRRPLVLASLFLLIFFTMRYLWEQAAGSIVERVVIHDIIVKPTSWVIQAIWPEQQVVAFAERLVSPLGRLNVLIGCDGLEMLFLLMAAFLAYPFAWRARLAGILLGAALVYALNVGRIVSLWHAWILHRDMFEWLHGTILPLALVACVFLFFLAFVFRCDDS